MKISLQTFLVILSLIGIAHAQSPQAAPDLAPPKKGVEVAPPLSADLPAAYTQLPSLGSIHWEVRRLPWVEEGPYAGISGMAMTTHDGKIYVVGGFIPGGDETSKKLSRRTSRWAWRYDPQSDEWSRLADAPFRREYTRGITAGDKIYLIGGGCQYKGQSPPYRVHGECAVLDLSANPPSWSHHSQLNVPRTHTAIGNVGNFLIVAGGNEYDFAEKGYSHHTIRDTTEIFDLAHPQRGWQKKAALPTVGRGWSASVIADGQLYLFGGLTWDEAGTTLGVNETVRYDPSSDRWQTLKPSPLVVSGWEGALYAERYAILTGGVMRPARGLASNIVWSDVVWAYDTQMNRWLSVQGFLPPGAVFNDPGVAILGETIYVIGAEGPAGSHYNYFLVGRIEAGE